MHLKGSHGSRLADIQTAGSWAISSRYLMRRQAKQSLVSGSVLPVANTRFQSPFSSGPSGPCRHWFPQSLPRLVGTPVFGSWSSYITQHLGHLDCLLVISHWHIHSAHTHIHTLLLVFSRCWHTTPSDLWFYTHFWCSDTHTPSHVHRTESLHPEIVRRAY